MLALRLLLPCHCLCYWFCSSTFSCHIVALPLWMSRLSLLVVQPLLLFFAPTAKPDATVATATATSTTTASHIDVGFHIVLATCVIVTAVATTIASIALATSDVSVCCGCHCLCCLIAISDVAKKVASAPLRATVVIISIATPSVVDFHFCYGCRWRTPLLLQFCSNYFCHSCYC